MNICGQLICISLIFSFQKQFCFGTVWTDISIFFEKLGNDVKCLTGSCDKPKKEEFKPPVLRYLPDPDDVATAMPPGAVLCIPISTTTTTPRTPFICIPRITTTTTTEYIPVSDRFTRYNYPLLGAITPMPPIDVSCENYNANCCTDKKVNVAMGVANVAFNSPSFNPVKCSCPPYNINVAAMGAANVNYNDKNGCVTYDNSKPILGSVNVDINTPNLNHVSCTCPTYNINGAAMGAVNVNYKDKAGCVTYDNSNSAFGTANVAFNTPNLNSVVCNCPPNNINGVAVGAVNVNYKDNDGCFTYDNSNAALGTANVAFNTPHLNPVVCNCPPYNINGAEMGAVNVNYKDKAGCVTYANNNAALGTANVAFNTPNLNSVVCNCPPNNINSVAVGAVNVNYKDNDGCITYDNSNAALGTANVALNTPSLNPVVCNCPPYNINGAEMGAVNVNYGEKGGCITYDNSNAALGTANVAFNTPNLNSVICNCPQSNMNGGAVGAVNVNYKDRDRCATYYNSNAALGTANAAFKTPNLNLGTCKCPPYNINGAAIGAANANYNNPTADPVICNCPTPTLETTVYDCIIQVGALKKPVKTKCKRPPAVSACKKHNKTKCKRPPATSACNPKTDCSPEVIDSHEGLDIIQANGVVARKLFNGRLPLK